MMTSILNSSHQPTDADRSSSSSSWHAGSAAGRQRQLLLAQAALEVLIEVAAAAVVLAGAAVLAASAPSRRQVGLHGIHVPLQRHPRVVRRRRQRRVAQRRCSGLGRQQRRGRSIAARGPLGRWLAALAALGCRAGCR